MKKTQYFVIASILKIGIPDAIRTHGLRFRRASLYPAELREYRNSSDVTLEYLFFFSKNNNITMIYI